MLEKKLVAYYRTGGKYDTPLDAIDVQIGRIGEWAVNNGFEIVHSVHDTGDFEGLEEAYDVAGNENGYVIVASPCRATNSAEKFLSYSAEESIPLLTTETIMDKSKGEDIARTMNLLESMMLAQQEYYRGMCEKWIG
jgi:hypothetical protein